MKNTLLAVFFTIFTSFTAVAHAELPPVNGEPVTQLDWSALMPEDYSLDSLFDDQQEQLANIDDYSNEAMLLMDEMMAKLQSAPIVPEMDGKMVRIPGFVVPVQGDGETIKTFFLVPYFGACLHLPPPPSNQIVYVNFEPGTSIDNLYDAIWVTGKLTIENTHNDLASSGYSLEAYVIEPYEAPPIEG
ncbi:MAG: DUF3299 domain-containing protein [Pontibacterium sp.]